mmetsp:Transcript_21442/g.49989  ORF Transcript_21442/g.49989 Transcript_21442/m.49989 type:complete len:603 (-) Transcript_21442:629-2437(-)
MSHPRSPPCPRLRRTSRATKRSRAIAFESDERCVVAEFESEQTRSLKTSVLAGQRLAAWPKHRRRPITILKAARAMAKMVRCALLAFAANTVARAEVGYTAPTPSGEVLFLDSFQEAWDSRWTHSTNEVYSGKFAAEGYTVDGIPGDVGLTMPKKAHRYGISRRLDTPVVAGTTPLVVQYEVSLKGGLECGGAYMKLLDVGSDFDGAILEEPTPYSIMFGPDKCANAGKIHFIFNFKNPITGEVVQHHLKKGPPMPPTAESVPQTHLYRFALLASNKLELSIDDAKPSSYSLLEDFEPPVNPLKQIDDPTDTKPAEWVDDEMIADPAAFKPEEWDENAPYEIADPAVTKPEDWHDDAPAMVAAPSATKPNDWDDEEDGEWEAPLVANPLCSNPGCGLWNAPKIPNPDYRGKWNAPMVENPAYKGDFKPQQIDNPAFFEDLNPGASLGQIGAVGFELWTMDEGTLFDNILIAQSLEVAMDFSDKTWKVRHEVELAAAKEKAGKSDAAPAGDSIVNKFVFYARKAADLVVEKPVPSGVSLFVLVFSLLLLCCMPTTRKSAPPAAAEAAAAVSSKAAAATETEPQSEGKAGEESLEKSTPSARTR